MLGDSWGGLVWEFKDGCLVLLGSGSWGAVEVELFAGAQVELPSKREPLTSRVPRRARRILGVRVAVVCEPACFILH